MTKYKGYDAGEMWLKAIIMGVLILAVIMSGLCFASGLFMYLPINILNAVIAILYLIELNTY